MEFPSIHFPVKTIVNSFYHTCEQNTEDFGCPGLFVQYLLHLSLDKPSFFRHIQKVRYISFFEYGKAG